MNPAHRSTAVNQVDPARRAMSDKHPLYEAGGDLLDSKGEGSTKVALEMSGGESGGVGGVSCSSTGDEVD